MIDYLHKIDALVAEHVMGWVDVDCRVAGYGDAQNNTKEGPWYEWRGRPDNKSWTPLQRIPFYSFNINEAWCVLAKLRDRYDVVVGQDKNGDSFCRLYTNRERDYCERQVMKASSPSLAICLAALKAAGVALPAPDVATASGQPQTPAFPGDSVTSSSSESEGP